MLDIKFSLISIGCGGLGGFIYNFFSKRYSFFKFAKMDKEHILLLTICKAVDDKCDYFGIDNSNSTIGRYPYNEWIKPYKHFPIPQTNGGLNFYDPTKEKNIYQIDKFLFFMIKIFKIFKNKTIINIDYSEINKTNCSNNAYKINFYKNKDEVEEYIKNISLKR